MTLDVTFTMAPSLFSRPRIIALPTPIPEGSVLVTCAGSSGVQIADELLRAGCRVYLSVGAHDRPPRAYRGHDSAGGWVSSAEAAAVNLARATNKKG